MSTKTIRIRVLVLVVFVVLSLLPEIVISPIWAIVVTNTKNGGPGSLRQAIRDANANGVPPHKTFDLPFSPATIWLPLRLPSLTRVRDTMNESGARVVLNGSTLTDEVLDAGLHVSASNLAIRRVRIERFRSHGITLSPDPAVSRAVVMGVISSNNVRRQSHG